MDESVQWWIDLARDSYPLATLLLIGVVLYRVSRWMKPYAESWFATNITAMSRIAENNTDCTEALKALGPTIDRRLAASMANDERLARAGMEALEALSVKHREEPELKARLDMAMSALREIERHA
jgi:hypothetical protein